MTETYECPEVCECEKPGFFHSGVPGILAHMEEGKLAAGSAVEHCDACLRYPSDEAAYAQLLQLGLIPDEETKEQCFTVHCFVSVRVEFDNLVAASPRAAAAIVLQQFDWEDHRDTAVFDDGITDLLVDCVGDPEYRRSQRFDATLAEVSSGSPQPVVWLLTIRSELGPHTTVCQSYESAKRELFGYVKDQWESEFGDTSLPDDPKTAIRRFFDRSSESYDIQDVNVV